MFWVSYFLMILQTEAEGKSVEEEINKKNLPGEAVFIFCDVTKDDDVKVGKFLFDTNIDSCALLRC